MKGFVCSSVFSVVLSGSASIVPSVPEPILLTQKLNFQPANISVNTSNKCQVERLRCRNSCHNGLSIIPLIPPNNRGLTVTESPTFFAYVSQTSRPVEFILQAENGIEVYKTTFKVDRPGVVAVRIPAVSDSTKSLEIGKEYQWFFQVSYDSSDRSADYYVTGCVQRIEPHPTLKSELANPDPMARAIAYAKYE
ncbi:MAG: DUF928 domain-containing protein, partial [Microcoleus sp.]